MQLRSGRSISASIATRSTHPMTMRRNSRNYEEFNERKKYQAEQRAIEETIYTSDEEILKSQKKHIYSTIRHLLYALEYQKKNNYSLYQMIDTCIELYTFINNNIQFIVDNNVFDNRLFNLIVKKGNYIINEIHRKDKTRAQTKKFERCRYYIGNVIDLIEHYILKLY
jgi:hypothetical protein